jgi:inosine-uridine nucleoside N-ribohydrolase
MPSNTGTFLRTSCCCTHPQMIIDCDAGIDDAQALVAVLTRDDIDVLAITATYGNCPLAKVVTNIKKTLVACGK